MKYLQDVWGLLWLWDLKTIAVFSFLIVWKGKVFFKILGNSTGSHYPVPVLCWEFSFCWIPLISHVLSTVFLTTSFCLVELEPFSLHVGKMRRFCIYLYCLVISGSICSLYHPFTPCFWAPQTWILWEDRGLSDLLSDSFNTSKPVLSLPFWKSLKCQCFHGPSLPVSERGKQD